MISKYSFVKPKYSWRFNLPVWQVHLRYRHSMPAPVDRTSASAWLVVKTLIDRMSKNKLSTQMSHGPAIQSYVQLLAHSCINTQETVCQMGVRSFIIPGLPTHLVQELKAGTTAYIDGLMKGFSSGNPCKEAL